MGDHDRPGAGAGGVGGQADRLAPPRRRARALRRVPGLRPRRARGPRARGDHEGLGARPPRRWVRGARTYDLVVLDGPASGHGIGMLRTPRTFAEIARVGPIASQAKKVVSLLENPSRSAMVAVALPSELPVTETLELEGRMATALGRPLDAIVVNSVLPRRFTAADVERVAAADGKVPAAVSAATRRQQGLASMQQGQLRRLRRDAASPVVTLPFLATPNLEVEDVRMLGDELRRAPEDSSSQGRVYRPGRTFHDHRRELHAHFASGSTACAGGGRALLLLAGLVPGPTPASPSAAPRRRSRRTSRTSPPSRSTPPTQRRRGRAPTTRSTTSPATRASDDDCPFTQGVGTSGIYFSFAAGHLGPADLPRLTAPATPGLPSVTTIPTAPPRPGRSGRCPHYNEDGLVPTATRRRLRAAPLRRASRWSDGSRLYYANLTATSPRRAPFKGLEAIAVSHADDVRPRPRRSRAWNEPVIVDQAVSTTFSDKERSGPTTPRRAHFGNVYVCYVELPLQRAALCNQPLDVPDLA